jgi:hypothetical protein
VWDPKEDDWFGATVVKLSEDKSKAKVHYSGWSSCYDEWICVSTSRMRPWTSVDEPSAAVDVSDQVLYTSVDDETPRQIGANLSVDVAAIVRLNR